MHQRRTAGFSLIEAVIALLIATMTLAFIGTAGYALRFAADRTSDTANRPEDLLALRRILHDLTHGAIGAKGGPAHLALIGQDPLHIQGQEGRWHLTVAREAGAPYPLPSVLLESDTPLSFRYRHRGAPWREATETTPDTIALLAEDGTRLMTVPMRHSIDPACLLRTGPRRVTRCLP